MSENGVGRVGVMPAQRETGDRNIGLGHFFQVPGVGHQTLGTGIQVQVQVLALCHPSSMQPSSHFRWLVVVPGGGWRDDARSKGNRRPDDGMIGWGYLGRAGSPSPPLSRLRSVSLSANGRFGEPSLPNPETSSMSLVRVSRFGHSVLRHRFSPQRSPPLSPPSVSPLTANR